MPPTRKSSDRLRPNSLKLHPSDNVAVALRPLRKGQLAVLAGQANRLQLAERIHVFHKFALERIPAGAHVIKYGEKIGRTTRLIRAGEHVHTHNLASERGRGDLTTKGKGERNKTKGEN